MDILSLRADFCKGGSNIPVLAENNYNRYYGIRRAYII